MNAEIELLNDESRRVDASLGQRIKQRREALRMSQSALGGAIGVTFQQIQKYERGVNRISASSLYGIALALNVSPAAFFGAPASGCMHAPAVDPETKRLEGAYQRIGSQEVKRRILALVQAMEESAAVVEAAR